MHRAQEQVRDFERAAGREAERYDQPHDWDNLWNYRNWIEEEFAELEDALRDRKVPAVARELCDMIYFVYGLATAMGINLEPYFEEVHRANMEKSNGPVRYDGKRLKPEVGWRGPDCERIHQADPRSILS